MILSDLIHQNIEEILQEWEDYARKIQPTHGSIDTVELRNHAKEMLIDMADELDKGKSKSFRMGQSRGLHPLIKKASKSALKHGLSLYDFSLSINDIIGEYSALRASIMRLWTRNEQENASRYQILLLNEELDGLIREAVEAFAAEAHKQRRLLEEFISSFQDHYYILQSDGRFIYANESMLNHFDVKYPSLMGKTHHDLHLLASEELYNEAMRVIATQEERSGEVTHILPSGEEKIYEYVYTPLLGGQKTVEGVAALERDITERKLAEEALQQRTDRVHDLYNQAPCGYHSLDNSGKITEINDTEVQWLGYPRKELLGLHFFDLLADESKQVFTNSFSRLKEMGISEDLEVNLVRKDRSTFPVLLRSNVVTDKQNQFAWCRSILFDITERKRNETRLRQDAIIFENTNQGIIVISADKKIVTVNRAFTTITGYTEQEALGQKTYFHISHHHDEQFIEQLWADVNQFGHWQGEILNRRKNGEIYPVWENISAVKNGQGKIENYVSVLSDISPIKHAEARLTYLAHHDVLTGLPNRLFFNVSLEKALVQSQRQNKYVALMFLDLDRFKRINDTMGHAVGDQLLQTIADRLRQCVRAEDTVARLGGDEFTIILENIAHQEDASLLAKKIISTLAEPIEVDGHRVITSTSIGIALYPGDADNSKDLARAADVAMYHAKDSGRNTFQYYTSDLTDKAIEHFNIENGLRRALQNNELVLFYQPLVEIGTGKIVEVEAFIRWQHPDRGLLLPGDFLPVAEESSLIDAIGEWVLHSACAQAKTWRESHFPLSTISINISGKQLNTPAALNQLFTTLQKSLFEEGELHIDLEITENLVRMVERNEQTAKRFHELGVMFAIDDFGTGYSSMKGLKHLPIDALKIDQTFIHDIHLDRDDKAIASAIVAMAHKMGIKVIAEGVETEAQLQVLKKLGCDMAQGYLFSKPVPASDISNHYFSH